MICDKCPHDKGCKDFDCELQFGAAGQPKREPERFFPFEFEVWQSDDMVASASGPREDALREAMHYAAQYEQDGPVRVFEVTRTLVRPNVK